MDSKMNKEVVRKMIKRIESVPEHYDQAAFFVESNDIAPCGTVACLAGEAVICSAPTVEAGIKLAFQKYDDIPALAANLLGLPNVHAIFSADGSGWPEPYARQFAEAEESPEAQAKVAVAYLKEALKRGTMIWDADGSAQ